jgi:MFS family permease
MMMVLSTIGRAGVSAAFASVYVYTVELFPTSVRHRSLALCSMFARVGNLIAPFISDLVGSLIHSNLSCHM